MFNFGLIGQSKPAVFFGVAAGFLLAVGATRLPGQQARITSGSLTAAEAVDRIVKATGAALPDKTVDTIKAGNPATVVTGIATTFTPSMEVLRKAVAAGDNLIVTHEPTFYNHLDDPAMFVDDPVYKEKLAYINEHHLVVWRFHDTWHLRNPDGIVEGFVARAGWKQYQNPGEEEYFTLPQTTVLGLAKDLEQRFHARVIRVIGDPGMKVTKVGYLSGASGEAKHVKALERDDVEVLVVGEAPEWETVEYVRDAQLEGRHKALILLGHLTSEEVGMENCAAWLKPMFPGLRVDYVPAGEPYWEPKGSE
jgi:putative NIF3 family GTP cyclohydrolase 1 type 2